MDNKKIGLFGKVIYNYIGAADNNLLKEIEKHNFFILGNQLLKILRHYDFEIAEYKIERINWKTATKEELKQVLNKATTDLDNRNNFNREGIFLSSYY